VVAAEHLDGPPRPRTLVDLGVPRNVAPSLAGRADTRLIDVDSLGTWGPRPADALTTAAEAEVARWAARFDRWLRTAEVLPTIARLRDEAERVRERELARALRRLGDLGEREQTVVRELAARLVAKLLHHPLAALSEAPDAPALAESARRLHALDVVPDDTPVPSLPAAERPAPAGV
jgi:glutamyl-tRNA reductase